MGPNNVVTGMLLGAAAYALFALNDATNKYLVTFLPVAQALFCRSVVIFVGCLAIGRGRLVTATVATPVMRLLLIRAVLTLVGWLCYFTAAPLLPFAQLMTLYFAAPILTTLLAIRILDEQVTRVRWLSILVGFSGVVIAADPAGLFQGGTQLWAIGLVMVASVMWGYAAVLIRQIAKRETAMVQMLVQNAVSLVATGAWMLLYWVPPTPWQVVLLIAIGVIGAAGQLLQFEAIRRAPVAVMGVVEYSGLIWAFLLGWLMFGDQPPAAVYVGAAVILCAGIFLVFMEHRQGRSDSKPR